MIENRIISLILISFFLLLCSGCSDKPDDQADYKGVGKLVADRNEARMASAANRQNRETGSGDDAQGVKINQGRSTEVIIEEEARIVSAASGRIMATATVFLDKKGNIINIRIKKE